jgi:hypothetical protein
MDEDDDRRIIGPMVVVTDQKVIYRYADIITNTAHDFIIE